MPKRAPKPKTTKKAAPKTRRKSKPSKPSSEAPAKETTQSNIVDSTPVTIGAKPVAVEPAVEPVPSVATEPLPEVHPEEAAVARPMAVKERAPVAGLVAAKAEQVAALPSPVPPVSLPPEASEAEAELEGSEDASVAEELPLRRDVPPNHMFIGKKPVMGYSLSAVMQLTQYDEVVLRARGKAISRAVDVAEVIIHRLGNGQFVARYIKIDTDVVGEGAEKRNVSTIEIGVGKKA